MQEAQSNSSAARRDLAALIEKLLVSQSYVVVTTVPLRAGIDIDVYKTAVKVRAHGVKFTLSNGTLVWPNCELVSVKPCRRELHFQVKVGYEELLRVFKAVGSSSYKPWQKVEAAWLALKP